MFKGKKIIIFDMDGTLIDSVGIWNLVDMELVRELGCREELKENEVQQQRIFKYQIMQTTQYFLPINID